VTPKNTTAVRKKLPPRPPTAKQLKVRVAVEKHIARNGYSPSIRELCVQTRIKSTNGVKCHLDALRRKGLVDWVDGKTRTIRPTEVIA
jgi:repressor LexA